MKPRPPRCIARLLSSPGSRAATCRGPSGSRPFIPRSTGPLPPLGRWWRALSSIALALAPLPALAQQPQCGERTKITYALANQFLEAPLLEAIDGAGNVVEWWGNPATGTWSLLSTKPGGPTCMIQSGDGFSIVPLDPGGDPA